MGALQQRHLRLWRRLRQPLVELDAASLHEQPLRESSSTQRDHHLTPIDVRTTADGDALLRWIRLDGTAPAGTSLGLQYRTAPDALLLNGMDWLPKIGNFSYNHPIGNHTVPEPSTTGTDRAVQEFLDLSPWLQIRIVMATTEGEAWTLPDMDKVSWGMEEMVFTHIDRTALQSYGQPLNLTTLIDVEEDWSQAVLVLDAGFGRVQRIVAEEQGGSWTLSSPEDGVRAIHAGSSHVHANQAGPLELTWNLQIEQGVVNLDQMQVHLELLADDGGLVFAAAPENPTWTWDNEVEVHLDAVTADGKGLMASASTVVAADNTLSVSLSTDFPGRNDAPANGSFQARMHLAVEGLAAGQLVPAVTWFNTSTAWVDLDFDAPDPLQWSCPRMPQARPTFALNSVQKQTSPWCSKRTARPLSSTRKRQPCLAAVRTRPPMPTSVPIETSS